MNPNFISSTYNLLKFSNETLTVTIFDKSTDFVRNYKIFCFVMNSCDFVKLYLLGFLGLIFICE